MLYGFLSVKRASAVSRDEQSLYDELHICSTYSNNFYFVPYSIDATGVTVMFFPYPPSSGNEYYISFPSDRCLYIDGIQCFPGSVLPHFSEQAMHTIKYISEDIIIEAPLSVYYADNLPFVSITAKSNETESIISDPFHKNIINAGITVIDPSRGESVYDRCEFAGHGGSTWEVDKKSFEFKMNKAYSLLGMKSAEKFTLIANGMDHSNLKNRIVYEATKHMHTEYPTECEYINYYLNGIYQGLYLLTERPSNSGGIVETRYDLDKENELANPSQRPSPIVNYEGTANEERYYNYRNNPKNLTGDYFMEFVQFEIPQGNHEEKSWFMTDRMMIKLKSPRMSTEKELNYIKDYCRSAERSVFSPYGIDPQTGADYHDFFDIYSWATTYLFMDFFGYQDDSAGSLFLYKKLDDPLLYSGPIWDYDKSMTDNYYDEELFPWYGRSDFYVVYDVNNKYELWYSGLNRFDDFHKQVVQNYCDELEPALNDIIETKIPEWKAATMSSVRMDEIRWSRGSGTESEKAENVSEWLKKRKELFDAVWINGEYSPYAGNIY